MTNLEIKEFCEQCRNFIIEKTIINGGHLSPNLGSVESIVMLHKIFDIPNDKIYFDIGHQAYVHKILTGRSENFDNLRHDGGISGFLKFRESKTDLYEGGHSSTAINASVGHSIGCKISNKKYNVIGYIGDGAFENGINLEALNHLGALEGFKNILILNDNNQSITPPIGGISKKLNEIKNKLFNIKDINKKKFSRDNINNPFYIFNINYLGPINGHDIKELEKAYNFGKMQNSPILIHIITEKGKGKKYAEDDKIGIYHSIKPNLINSKTGKIALQKTTTREKIKIKALIKEMKKNKNIVSIFSAMMLAVGISKIDSDLKNNIYDVGIQEEHAALLAVGLHRANKIVYLDYFATFLNRAYDILLHDLTRMKIPVIIGAHQTGLSPASGNTHHVLQQLKIFSTLPNTIIIQPSDTQEIFDVYHWAFNYNNKKNQIIIRTSAHPLPIIDTTKIKPKKIIFGKWKYEIENKNCKAYLITYGAYLDKYKNVIQKKNLQISLINALFLKPIDMTLLKKIILTGKPVFIYDDTFYHCGLGSIILDELKINNIDSSNVTIFGYPEKYFHHGSYDNLMNQAKQNIDQIIDKINKKIN